MRRALKLAAVSLILAVALFTALSLASPYHYPSRALLVKVRESVFSVTATSLEPWNASPAELQEKYGFLTDGSDDARHLAEMASSALADNSPLPAATPFPENVLKSLSPPAEDACGTFKGLEDVLQRLTRRDVSGCCSDFTLAFIALSAAKGVFAREVRIKGHTFAEYYSPREKSWIWVDPMFGITAASPLSFVELRQLLVKGVSVTVLDHRTKKTFILQEAPERLAKLYTPGNLKMNAMLLGNNVYAEHAFETKILALPASFRQLLSYMAGVKPRTLVFNEK